MASEIICSHCSFSNQPGESFCEHCGAQLNSSQTPGAAQVMQASHATLLKQRYRVLNALGEGGFGKVYKVEDTHLARRLLAAKKLQPDVSVPAQQAIDDFRREAEMLATLKHPNLPEIYDFFQEGSDSYLIMELIAGETLEDRLENSSHKPLPTTEVLRIGIELATVLDYLHTRTPPIIFRDLKPGNMMLTPTGKVYLIDFGIARHLKPGQRKDTKALGSEGYAPPEQYGRKQTTPQSDIYSLGAILHQLLTGNKPYDSPFQFAPLTGQRPDLQHLLECMLRMNEQERPASAVEVKQKLQKILQELQQPIAKPSQQKKQAIPPTSKANSTPQKKFPGTQSAQPTISSSVQQNSQPPLPKACGDLLHKYSQHSSAIRALAWSPDGDTLASAGEDQQVHVWQATTGKPVCTYQKHTRTVNALAWSPDSQHLASTSNDHSVQIWKANSGQSLSQYQEHRHWVQALSWSSDGKLIASGDAANQVHLWDARSGQQQRMYQGHKSSILALAFSPDARLIASADEGGAVHIWEGANGKLLITYTGHQKAVSSLAWSPDGKRLVSGSWDRTLHIWEVTSGKQLATYTTHQRMVNAVVWSPANSLIASASKDQTVQVWDASTCQALLTYHGHTANINALHWSPDGSYLASSGDDATVHVWRAH